MSQVVKLSCLPSLLKIKFISDLLLSYFFNSLTNFSLPLLLRQLETNWAASPRPSVFTFLARWTFFRPNSAICSSRFPSGGVLF